MQRFRIIIWLSVVWRPLLTLFLINGKSNCSFPFFCKRVTFSWLSTTRHYQLESTIWLKICRSKRKLWYLDFWSTVNAKILNALLALQKNAFWNHAKIAFASKRDRDRQLQIGSYHLTRIPIRCKGLLKLIASFLFLILNP